jgi:hypothetical protein
MSVTNYFTFGFDHSCPETEKDLSNHYVEITAPTEELCRQLMFQFYEDKWAFQYEDEDSVENLILYEKIEINRIKI